MAELTRGWGPPPTASTTAGRQKWVLAPIFGLLGLAICGLLVLGLVSSSIGPGAVIVGTLCALLPVGPVVAAFLWLDRWEPEPPRLLLFAFLWGACFATLTALLINSGAALVIDNINGNGDVYGAVVVAPFVEELVKGAFVVGLLLIRYREFDGIVDGIVYAGLVAAGFAFTENILYIGRAFAEAEVAAGGAVLGVLLLRGVLSPFAHPMFTIMIGIACGIASWRHRRHTGVRVGVIVVGYLLAVGLHALWNGAATFGGGGGFLGVYAFVMLPLFLAMVGVVVWQRRREQRTVVDQLPGFAQAGWIAPSEIELLSSLAGRRGWQAAVRRRSGKEAAKAVIEYQNAVTELAFLRARIARGTVGSASPLWHEHALFTLIRARTLAVGRHTDALTHAVRHHAPQTGAWPTAAPMVPPPAHSGPPMPEPLGPQSWPPPVPPPVPNSAAPTTPVIPTSPPPPGYPPPGYGYGPPPGYAQQPPPPGWPPPPQRPGPPPA